MNKKNQVIIASSIITEIENIKDKCNGCGICVKECSFLQLYGNPKKIAEEYNADNPLYTTMAYECSLCGLCTAVCKRGVQPEEFFLQMRIAAAAGGHLSNRKYSRLLAYEKTGTSERFTQYTFPENCDTVFFPGCNLPGTRPDKVFKIYNLMKKNNPAAGIVFDCCTKPSHDLGRHEYFNTMFSRLQNRLLVNGVKNVITACPNCYKVFKKYGKPLKVTSIYEYISENLQNEFKPSEKSIEVVVHDPCSLRNEKAIHEAVRKLISHTTVTYSDMEHTKSRTLCCGEGGAVSMVKPEFADTWTEKIKTESCGKIVVTSCGGCAGFIGKKTSAVHVIDLLFNTADALSGKFKISSSPFTYINRLMLKRKIRKNFTSVNIKENRNS